MTAPFDIFQAEVGGSLLWRETAVTFEDAKTRIQELAAQSPVNYLIVNQRTGHKIEIRPDGAAEVPHTD